LAFRLYLNSTLLLLQRYGSDVTDLKRRVTIL
jgi:hypothetical protein